jgi:adenylate cyclase
MQADEAGTHSRLKSRFMTLVNPSIESYGGRTVKLMGDGLLVEFPSVVSAVEWATDIQARIAALNANETRETRIEYRVGITIGDVIIDGDDIYGDGVNLSARLQAMADPGGLCISDIAMQQLRGKVDVAFADRGAVNLKNIAGPVQVWGWTPVASTEPRAEQALQPAPGFWARPSIAVLPLTNMSQNPEEEVLADGIAEDILTRLAMWRWLPVVARNSSFAYKGRAVDIKQVGQELGARYVLEGSIRRSGNQVRITGQLIDAESGDHVWAQKYDRDLSDIFALQDEITDAVVAALEPAVGRAEMSRAQRKTPTDLNAWDLYQKGMSELSKATREGLEAGRGLFEKSTEADPLFAPPFAGIALSNFMDNTMGFTSDATAIRSTALKAALRAVALDDIDPFAHAAVAWTGFWNQDHESAVAAGRRSVELNPSYPLGYHALAAALLGYGDFDGSIDAARSAIRIGSNDPWSFFFFGVLSASLYMRQDYEEAREAANIGMQKFPWYPSSYRWKAIALAQLGQVDAAKATLGQFLDLSPRFDVSAAQQSYSFRRKADRDHYIDGLRKAGLA